MRSLKLHRQLETSKAVIKPDGIAASVSVCRSVCRHSFEAEVNILVSSAQLPLLQNPHRRIIHSCWRSIGSRHIIINAKHMELTVTARNPVEPPLRGSLSRTPK